MNGILLAVALSFMSTVCYAFAAVEQERVAAQLGSRRKWLETFQRGRWWFAVIVTIVGGVLHLVALRYGPLTLVQPLGVLTLVVALPLGALLGHHSVTSAEWLGAALTVTGLAGLVFLTAPVTPHPVLGRDDIIAITTVGAAVITALTVVGAWSRRSWAKGLFYGTASGVAFGVAAAMSQVVVAAVPDDGFAAITQPVLVLLTVLAIAGILLSQVAYHSGLALPLAATTLANPVTATLIGLTMFDQGYTTGPAGAVLAATSALTAGCGVAVLARASRH